MPYAVALKPAAERALEKLRRDVQERLVARITALGEDSRPRGVEKLRGDLELFRVRVGDYRIIYQVEEDTCLVLIAKIGHRREVYRNL